MPLSKSTYHSTLFLNFKELKPDAYRDQVRFFELNKQDIDRLKFNERFELLVAYVNALFEIGAYPKQLEMIDVVIEETILHNVHYFKGRDVYRDMLFRKASALYGLLEYEKADYILRELVKIYPNDRECTLFLKKCLLKKKPAYVRFSHASAILLFILTAILIGVELFYIRPFHSLHTLVIETIRFSTFGLGILGLMVGDIIHFWQVEWEVNLFVKKRKEKKFQQKNE